MRRCLLFLLLLIPLRAPAQAGVPQSQDAASEIYSPPRFVSGTAQASAPQLHDAASMQQAPDAAAQQAPGSVEGRVTNSETGDGIGGATIRLVPVGRRGSSGSDRTATSRSDGTFTLDGIAPGNYFVMATQSSFMPAAEGQPQRTYIQVETGQTVGNVALQLSPVGRIRGKVVDDEGHPVSGARVQAFTTYSARGKTQLRRVSESSTDQQGKYTLKTQGPGKYYLLAEPDDEDDQDEPEQGSATPETARPDLVRTFYPKSLDLEGATALDTSSGQDTADVTIQLLRAAAYHLRGKIEGWAPATPNAGRAANRQPSISLGPRGGLSSDGLGKVLQPEADGTFDIPKVLPGSYTLTLIGPDDSSSSHPGRGGRTRLLARQDIDVGAADVNGIVLAVVPLMRLSGRVTVEGQENASLQGIRISIVPAGPEAVGGFQMAPVESDGTFAVEDLAPGNYTVRVSGAPSGAYVKAILYNRQDITTSGVDLTQGGGGELQVLLRTGTGEVDGVIPNASTISATIMILAPETVGQDGSGVLMANMQAAGSFVARDVPPGRYYAFALQRWSPLWQNADFLRQMQNQGASVDVAENGHVQVELPVITAEQVQAAAMPLGLTAQ
jgi:hypothetical protein